MLVPVLGQQLRERIRAGTGVPLAVCNGIGASLEVLDPVVEQLNPDTTVVRFDVPGAGALLAKMLTPRRFLDHDYAATIAGELYGGAVRTVHRSSRRWSTGSSWPVRGWAMCTSCSPDRSGRVCLRCH